MALIYCKILDGYNFDERPSSYHNRTHVYYWREYVGKCINIINNKGDDLYMLVWDDISNAPIEVKYASKSVWSYSRYASLPDATLDCMQKYEAWQSMQVAIDLKQRRTDRAIFLRKIHNLEVKVSIMYDVDLSRLRKLWWACGQDKYIICLKLLVQRVRNEFKKTLKNILINQIKSDTITNNEPFTYRQWVYIKNFINHEV